MPVMGVSLTAVPLRALLKQMDMARNTDCRLGLTGNLRMVLSTLLRM